MKFFAAIDNCSHIGAYADNRTGRLYCRAHWEEERSHTACTNGCEACTCVSTTPCDVLGCVNEGKILQSGTGKHYCIDHAWKADRIEQGLRHPPIFNDDDLAFLRTCGVSFEGDVRN